MKEEFEQRYIANGMEPIQVWLFCRMCRCRVQVRTVPRPEMPFRCFCGHAGTFKSFDVFEDEEEVRRFAKTFEEVYQTTKGLLQDADMPMPQTQIYRADELKALRDAHERVDETRDEMSSEELSQPEDAAGFRRRTRDMADQVVRAPDVVARHEALSRLGKYAFARRDQFPDARRLCYQVCETDVSISAEVVREATARYKRGEQVQLKFPLFKRLVALYMEDKQLENALEIATRAVRLGIPGYEERVAKLRAQLQR